MADIPFDRLGIPEAHRQALLPDAPVKARMVAARGLLPLRPEALLGMAFVLLGDSDERISSAAHQTLCSLPADTVLKAVHQETHPKLLEYLVENREIDQGLLEKIYSVRSINDRTACLVARDARGEVVMLVARNQERLLITPGVYLQLAENPDCSASELDRVESFLRLNRCLPERPVSRAPPPPEPEVVDVPREALETLRSTPETPAPQAAPVDPAAFDLDMFDLEESKGGDLGGFDFNFQDESRSFTWEMLKDDIQEQEEEEKLRIEQQIRKMTVGQKIKLAYQGNITVRRLLVRDANKMVSSAVVKSGRMTETEIKSAAGNPNLDGELLRKIARDKSTMRKYPVKVALANNPKCPVPIAVGILAHLSKGDLKNLSNSRQVSSVVFNAAKNLYRKKYQRGQD